MVKGTSQRKQQVESIEKPKKALNGETPHVPTSITKRKASAPKRGRDSYMLGEEQFLEEAEPAISSSGDAASVAFDDLDATERFDLGDTLNRGTNAHGGSIVELLDEAYDRLALDEGDVTEIQVVSVKKTTRTRASKQNGHSPVADVVEVLEIETVEASPDEQELDE